MRFPGMDPYLEDAALWPGFHHLLADELVAQLNARIGPKYFADVDVRTVLQDVAIGTLQTVLPDAAVVASSSPWAPQGGAPVATAERVRAPILRPAVMPEPVRLRSVRVYLTGARRLVTVVEALSPINKRRGDGLAAYRRKRARLLRSPVHLVEIDLLRGGQRPGWEVAEPSLDTDYVLVVNRAIEAMDSDGRISEIWPIAISDALPTIPIPLLSPDPDALIDLGLVLRNVVQRAGYEWRIDYTGPVPPPELREAMAVWLREARTG